MTVEMINEQAKVKKIFVVIVKIVFGLNQSFNALEIHIYAKRISFDLKKNGNGWIIQEP